MTSSDLYDRGYGDIGIDFLDPKRRASNIVTNPPYNAAEGFVRSGLKAADRKFALLLRLAFLEGANRQQTIFSRGAAVTGLGLQRKDYFLPCRRGAQGIGHHGIRLVRMVGHAAGTTELRWFRPGYKAQYTRIAQCVFDRHKFNR